MSAPKAEAAGLTVERRERLRDLLDKATPGAWKLWGMTVMADQDGTSDYETAVPVAQTWFRDEHDKPRTWDASLIAESHNLLPALLDALAAAEAEVERIRALVDQWNDTPDYTPSEYDQGRVDQRHDMTGQLLEALDTASSEGA